MTGFKSRDEVFTYLIHIGYLAYEKETKRCFIPNTEIADEWVNAIELEPGYQAAFDLLSSSRKLLDSVIAGDAAAVSAALDVAHREICNNLNYNNEGTFQAVICLAFFYAKAKYTVFKELPTGKGYADVVLLPYVPDIPAMVIELKCNSSVESALSQIESKQYFASLAHYQGNLLFVGINYDKETQVHDCAIRKFEKA